MLILNDSRRALAVMLASTLALAGCMSDVTDAKPVKLTSAQVAQIEATVTHDFFDPASGQFRNVRAADVTTTDGRVERRVCGEVNGKNRMGGYVGFEMFGGVIQDGKFSKVDFFMPCEVS